MVGPAGGEGEKVEDSVVLAHTQQQQRPPPRAGQRSSSHDADGRGGGSGMAVRVAPPLSKKDYAEELRQQMREKAVAPSLQQQRQRSISPGQRGRGSYDEERGVRGADPY